MTTDDQGLSSDLFLILAVFTGFGMVGSRVKLEFNRVYALRVALVFKSPGASNVGQAEITMASTYIDPAVRAQLANVHDVFVIARHEKHGYLLLLNKGALGKEFKIPSGKFEHPGIGGDSYYKAASNAASCKMLVQTGLVIAPCRFNRILFPAQVQEKLGNRVFYEVWISDQDSVVKGGETALTGHGLVMSGKSDKCPTHFGDLNTASMNDGDDIPHSCPGGCLL